MRRILIEHLFYIGIISLVYYLLTKFGIGCPIRYLIGIPCPTCGVCHALLCLFDLNWGGYVSHNVMAVPLLFAALSLLHNRVLQNKKKYLVFSYVILIVNIVIYLDRYFI